MLTHLQQTLFENIVIKGKNAHNEQLTTKFNTYVSFIELFHSFLDVFKVVCYRIVVCGKGLTECEP